MSVTLKWNVTQDGFPPIQVNTSYCLSFNNSAQIPASISLRIDAIPVFFCLECSSITAQSSIGFTDQQLPIAVEARDNWGNFYSAPDFILYVFDQNNQLVATFTGESTILAPVKIMAYEPFSKQYLYLSNVTAYAPNTSFYGLMNYVTVFTISC